jgi:superfamily II DNA or RNA helicase
MNYSSFIDRKSQLGTFDGFDPVWMPDFLYDFQQAVVEWAIRKGRAAIFADCGLGKTPMQLVWAENIVRKTGKRVLVLTPLAVSHQTINEAKKFGIEAHRSRTGDDLRPGINVTNYEQLDRFSREDFIGVVCDESSILKSFDGATRGR